jgi:hypothetical protein
MPDGKSSTSEGLASPAPPGAKSRSESERANSACARSSALRGIGNGTSIRATMRPGRAETIFQNGVLWTGIDGPTDAAGGLVDGTTLDRARELGVDLDASLADNDAYPALDRLGDLVRTGPTDTNVGDLQVLVIGDPGAAPQ